VLLLLLTDGREGARGRRERDGGGETEERDGGGATEERETEETGDEETEERETEDTEETCRETETERRQEKEGFEWILGAMLCLFVSIFGGVFMF
jgi:hypothetical protein